MNYYSLGWVQSSLKSLHANIVMNFITTLLGIKLYGENALVQNAKI